MPDDIRVPTNYLRKLKPLRNRLGAEAVLSWLQLELFTRENFYETGVLVGYSVKDIAEAADYTGHEKLFIKALLDLGLLIRTDAGYALYDWSIRQPWAVTTRKRSEDSRAAANVLWEKRRAKAQRKVEAKRAQLKLPFQDPEDQALVNNSERSYERRVKGASSTRQRRVIDASTPRHADLHTANEVQLCTSVHIGEVDAPRMPPALPSASEGQCPHPFPSLPLPKIAVGEAAVKEPCLTTAASPTLKKTANGKRQPLPENETQSLEAWTPIGEALRQTGLSNSDVCRIFKTGRELVKLPSEYIAETIIAVALFSQAKPDCNDRAAYVIGAITHSMRNMRDAPQAFVSAGKKLLYQCASAVAVDPSRRHALQDLIAGVGAGGKTQ